MQISWIFHFVKTKGGQKVFKKEQNLATGLREIENRFEPARAQTRVWKGGGFREFQ
jgi:hypothetical protein